MSKQKELDIESKIILASLKSSVNKALDKKRRLGQYAVISENGKIIKLFTEESSEKCD